MRPLIFAVILVGSFALSHAEPAETAEQFIALRVPRVLRAALAAGVSDAQQSPAPSSAPAPAAQQPIAEKPPPETFTYQSEGRRDPFLNLLNTGSDPRPVPQTHKGEGPAALSVGEISVRGILQSRGSLIAMIAGPDNKTYIVHNGDKLLDATIKTITLQGLVMLQDVHDPLSPAKQREIHKMLQSLEGGKE
jgi:Tfp pilus assembly protein PilP